MKRETLLGILMFSCFFLIIGTAGAYENDAITGIQSFSRITVATILFFVLDHMRKKRALNSCNCKRAHTKNNTTEFYHSRR